ncbi:CvpA family protein [Pseudodesulfovibrio sp. zrk46]|uniref:CvpA family protein n=1 Tax=Pseudodesulfovibrio sp. zrk46 TaxID=2725288 RepID=UPI00144A1362|nr:CvpA family protein [Pseudodesulfovibrio sp. zrk46]QJB57486.1 CvpA family protein [Pseudodesulfovibrio sp. zrk46]
MNFLDIVLVCILAIFMIRGFFRGLVQEVLSLAAVVLAIFLASNYQHLLVPHLELYIESQVTVNALAYVIIFFGTLIIFWLLAKAIRTMLDIVLLGWVDRIAGGVFGIIEGALIALILLMFLQSFAPDSTWLQESKIAPRSQHLLQLVGDLAPNSMREALKSKGFEFPSPQDALNSAKEAIGLDDRDTQSE